ncbi:MAG: glycosyl hydrolase family 18 protein [Arcticibacter sp.]
MKKLSYFLLFISYLLASCAKEDEPDTSNYFPRIFDGGLVFQAPSRIIQEGESAVYTGLLFSPKPVEKTKISWKVNGQEVSTDTAFTFAPKEGGEFEIKLEASYNGQTATRISKVLVSPSRYTPKPAARTVMSYLSENATAAGINWGDVTHIAFNGARVLPGGSVDFSKSNQNQNLDELVARGHINGVPVLLGVSGRLSGVDGWSLYNSNDFGSSISDPALRSSLVETLASYVQAHRLDGIDIMMTDLSNDDPAIAGGNAAAVTPFLTALKAALPQGALVTVTVTTNYMHWEYANLSAADWINVHAFENGVTVGPGAKPGQASPFNFMTAGATIWTNKGIPANKLVLGIPAFGLRYNELDANGNNASWGSYEYMPFSAILAADPGALERDSSTTIAKGVYYNGKPLVSQKATYIKNQGFRGAYVWAGNYDAAEANSLIKIISGILK